MFGNPMEIAIVVGAAVLLFGGSKIRDVARGLGAAKKEFMVGQAEADLAAERARADARAQAEANAQRYAEQTPITTSPSATVPSASGSSASSTAQSTMAAPPEQPGATSGPTPSTQP
jgi:TatA/E family protein of Tat protein translocase